MIRWRIGGGIANAACFDILGLQWMRLRNGVLFHVGIGHLFIAYVRVWRES